MADSTRAWEYRGERFYMEGVPFGYWMEPGMAYVSTEPVHPDDIALVRPAEVTAEDVRAADIAAAGEGVDVGLTGPAPGLSEYDEFVARFLTERLAARQATPEAQADA